MWFSFFAGPAAYVTQLLLGYALTPLACSATKVPQTILSIAAIIVVVTGALLAFRRWRQLGGGRDQRGQQSAVSFMSLVGFVLCLLFLLLILFTALNMLLLDPCMLT
jgi:hypothetical protein